MIELQRKLIGDSVRNKAFYEALKKAIKKGESTVLDIGSGTGFLSFLASKLGAKHVTLIEMNDLVDASQKMAKKNGIQNATFIQAHSTDLPTPKQKYDIIVSETLGNYALEENILETLQDAKRFLNKDGVMIPSALSQFACPVSSPRLYQEIDVWDTGFDIDLSTARDISLHNMYVKTIQKDDLLPQKDAIQEWDCIDLTTKNASVRKKQMEWTMMKPVTIYGIGLWWSATLIHDITISTSPLEKPTHWEQIFLPVLMPIDLQKDDVLSLSLVSDTRYAVKINLQWAVSQIRKGKIICEQKMDMRKGWC